MTIPRPTTARCMGIHPQNSSKVPLSPSFGNSRSCSRSNSSHTSLPLLPGLVTRLRILEQKFNVRRIPLHNRERFHLYLLDREYRTGGSGYRRERVPRPGVDGAGSRLLSTGASLTLPSWSKLGLSHRDQAVRTKRGFPGVFLRARWMMRRGGAGTGLEGG